MYRVNQEDDARFEREYAASNCAVIAVAEHLELSGNEILITAAKDFVPREKYHDNCGDILVKPPGSIKFSSVEVKGRTFHFTCRDDFPFSSIIIDRVKDSGIASLYVTVNKSLTVGAFVSLSTQTHWKIEKVPDHKRKYGPNPQRLCPVEFAKFVFLKRKSQQSEQKREVWLKDAA